MQKWTLRALDADHCVATFDRVLIQIWRYDTSLSAVTNLNSIARAFMAEQHQPISSLAIVERTSPPPDDNVRADLARFYRELTPEMKVAIVVAEGGGFRAAIIRAVGLALSTFAPSRLPFTFATSVTEATVLIGPHLSPGAGGSAGLQRVIDEIRGQTFQAATMQAR